MKRFTVLAIMILTAIFAIQASAQNQSAVKNLASFANSQIDTASLPSDIGIYNRVGLMNTFTDTVSVKIYLDYKTLNSSSWTVTDSVTYTNAATSSENEWTLRNTTTDKMPGVATRYRFRYAFQSSGNGVAGTHKYTSVLNFR